MKFPQVLQAGRLVSRYNSPLKNGLGRHRDVVPSFTSSFRAKKIVRLAEASLVNRQLQKPGTAFATD